MSDERLRELERRWKETQAVEDEAAYLLERVRAGDLEQEKLELAAYCGHEGAQAAIGEEQENVPIALRVRRLSGRWGRDVAVRAALLALEAVPELPSELNPLAGAMGRAKLFLLSGECVAAERVEFVGDKLQVAIACELDNTLVRPIGWGVPAGNAVGHLERGYPQRAGEIERAILNGLVRWSLARPCVD
ncbi:hypothetical protein OAX78_04520 [Planctomycetota bacterium]|nr:hypothetical protein [Planctomycetota bacterium]